MDKPKFKLRQLYLESAEVEAEALRLQQEDPSLTLKGAVLAVFNNQKAEIERLAAKVAELESNGEIDRLKEMIEERDNTIEALRNQPAQDDLDMKIKVLQAELDAVEKERNNQFADLSTLAPEAAEYLRLVRNEVINEQLCPSTAHWILDMLNTCQQIQDSETGEYGYVPSTNEKVKEEWMQQPN